MKNCEHFWDDIVALALGEDTPEAERHVRECQECGEKFEHLQIIVASLRGAAMDAPADLVAAAKALMPNVRQPLVATLLRSSLGLAGIRNGENGEVQALFEADNLRFRVQYKSVAKGWTIFGEAPKGATAVLHRGRKFALDEHGYFEVPIVSLHDSEFAIELETKTIDVPPIE